MKINWKSSRKWSLPFNIILFNLCRLWPFRSKNIWVFGAREGTKFEDNSRYMFEYVCRKHQDRIRAVWLCNNASTLSKLNQKGYEVYYSSSITGKWMQLRAGVALYSHGLIDFGVLPLVGGACCVALWHGMGFKKIYNGKYTGTALFVKKILDHFYSWTYRDITPVTSDYAVKWVTEMFTLKTKGIKITGQPRNDALKMASREDILEQMEISSNKRIIIFMPTYRQPSLGVKAMENIVRNLYDNRALDEFLTETDSVFLVKLHPLTPHMVIPNRKNFVILDYQTVDDNQKLMAIADMLVTDYSSCFVDYALLNRPIVFYTPDEAEFLKLSESMEHEYFDLAALCKAKTPDNLVTLLRQPNMEVVKKTNVIFEDESIQNTCYSENVFNVICKEIGL